MMSTELRHRLLRTGSVRLHVVEAGPLDGEPVILLHGFPDFWIGWRAQIEALAGAGYRVVVPDQRGYNTSDKPKGIREYALPRLLNDLVGLADALGFGRFNLVGHDWGGIVAWTAGAKIPARLASLTILNAPHPEVLFPYALRSPSQVLRSSYAAFFQFPVVPDALLRARRFALLVRALQRSSRPGTFTAEDIADYRQCAASIGRQHGVDPTDPALRRFSSHVSATLSALSKRDRVRQVPSSNGTRLWEVAV